MKFPGLDPYSRDALRQLATTWRESPARPSVSARLALAWHDIVYQWVKDPEMPLLVQRGRRGRGRLLSHPCGRSIMPTDQAAAAYLYSLALEDRILSTRQLRDALEFGRWPIATTLTHEERQQAHYSGTLDSMDAPNLFELGYALCHVTHVGLRRGTLEERTETELVAHSLLFLSPVNVFLVPKEYAALGELPEFIDEMDDARSFAATPA